METIGSRHKELRKATYYICTAEKYSSNIYEKYIGLIVKYLRLEEEVLPVVYFKKIIPCLVLKLIDENNNGRFEGKRQAEKLLAELVQCIYVVCRRGSEDIAEMYTDLIFDLCAVKELKRRMQFPTHLVNATLTTKADAILCSFEQIKSLVGRFMASPPIYAATTSISAAVRKYVSLLERLCIDEDGAEYFQHRHELERVLFAEEVEQKMSNLVDGYCLVKWRDDHELLH